MRSQLASKMENNNKKNVIKLNIELDILIQNTEPESCASPNLCRNEKSIVCPSRMLSNMDVTDEVYRYLPAYHSYSKNKQTFAHKIHFNNLMRKMLLLCTYVCEHNE